MDQLKSTVAEDPDAVDFYNIFSVPKVQEVTCDMS